MRRTLYVCLSVVLLGVGTAAAQKGNDAPAPSDFLGTWTGTWEGGGSGGFELILEKSGDGKIGGRVSVTGEPTYQATLRTTTFEGKKMTALYDFPPDPQLEVELVTTFDGNTAKGTWSARQKGGAELAAGTWAVKRK